MSTMTASFARPALARPALARHRPVRLAPAVRPAQAARPAQIVRPVQPARHAQPAVAEVQGFHLTRRGRLLFRGLPLLVAVAVLTAAASFFGGLLMAPAAVSSDRAGAALETVTVMPGDNLWTIATTAAPEADPYQTMSRIADLNSLQGRELEVGTVLFVPAEG